MIFSDSYICGYFGMRNTGDDALLLATVWGATNFMGHKAMRVSNVAPLKLPGLPFMPAGLKTQQHFRGENRLHQSAQALLSKRVIFGGGSVLHNSHDINLKRHLIKLSGRRKGLALGVGLGPFRDRDAEQNCAKLLNECEFVGLRDVDSFELAKHIAPHANVKLTFDLAPLMLLNERLLFDGATRSGICFCLCPNERFSGDTQAEHNRLVLLARAIVRLHRLTGEPITLLDFNGHATLGDEQVHAALRALLPTSVPVSHLHYHHNPLVVLQRLASFKAVVSMRLHGSVMAYLADTPVISLNYHSKCAGWCRQIGQPERLQFDAKNIDLDRLVNVISDGIALGFMSPTLALSAALEKSLSNWRINDVYSQKSHFSGYSLVQQTVPHSGYHSNRARPNRPAA
ncbi:polysaccharide pyruvyl transferase family protein [Reinekea sp.]|jgi:polysaccharide pyruvyl transferase WcaK-like protein|uniref:polysaccharide pyruvyl transferase family protein n=1 Tax=Reinekea sp. TaxID=1970455 RepID=UPI002A834F2A|nr:polysaccharide pyruvyl transferase family protein [Reinekea sp.]